MPPDTPVARALARAAAAARWLDGRRPHLVVAALACGLALAPTVRGALPGVGAVALALALALVASFTAALAQPEWRPLLLGLAAASTGMVVGFARVGSIDRTAERALQAERFEGTAVVVQRPRSTRFGSWSIVELREGPARESRVVARADAGVPWPAGGEPGVVVRVSGSIEPPVR
nr:hypothetical protein [Actinomycetota bacterium]